jgi:transcriptional regulator with XRE-family HTH domain
MHEHDGSTGSAIRVMRLAQGLTLQQLADLAGTSPSYIGQVERGDRQPSQGWLETITAALAHNLLSGGGAQTGTA